MSPTRGGAINIDTEGVIIYDFIIHCLFALSSP